ncbi:MAG: class I SAM-dependent methyltransferase [bacterium]|nr:class I SAM-dependent methyltransferase [bacterium]
MHCKICDTLAEPIFNHTVLSKYDVTYYRCAQCYFIQTEKPYWIEEAYKNALNPEDTGLFKRNEDFRAKTSVLIFCLLGKAKKYVDFAGGYGIFTRMMRDVGFDFYWSDKYATNMMAKGFESKAGERFEAVTAFEVFEHMVSPHDDLKEILAVSDTVIFSTILVRPEAPKQDWWYYGFNHGQHVSLYSEKSLEVLAQHYGLNLYTNHLSFHMLTKKKLSRVVFGLLMKLSKYGLFGLIRFVMDSKTDADARQLLKNGI